MGYVGKRFEIIGQVSSHNSPRDHIDEARWNLLVAKINEIVKSDEFKSLAIDMNGDCEFITY